MSMILYKKKTSMCMVMEASIVDFDIFYFK